jgi:hypothetical protein
MMYQKICSQPTPSMRAASSMSRDRAEELHHQEDPDGHRHARQDQRVVAVVPAQIGEHRVERDEDRLLRHHETRRGRSTMIARLNGKSSRASA